MKILTFAKNGNDLKTVNLDLLPLYENVYYAESSDNERVHVIIKCVNNENTAYLWQGIFNKSLVFDPEQKEYLKTFAKNWVENAPNLKFINILVIAQYKLLGLDTTILEKKRAEFFENREKQKEIERLQRIKDAEKLQKENLERALSIKNQLINDKTVSYSELIFAVDTLDFKVHPRTKHSILNQNAGSFIGISTGKFTSKTANSTAQSIFEVVRKFAQS